MRIDNDNKIVWCSEKLYNWYTSFEEAYDPLANRLHTVARVGFGWGLTDYQDTDVSYYFWGRNTQKELMLAILNGYEFKLECQKCHWRKREEYLLSFENKELVLLESKVDGSLKFGNMASYDNSVFKGRFMEQEVHERLGDDFYMLEKVEED